MGYADKWLYGYSDLPRKKERPMTIRETLTAPNTSALQLTAALKALEKEAEKWDIAEEIEKRDCISQRPIDVFPYYTERRESWWEVLWAWGIVGAFVVLLFLVFGG